MNFLRAMEGNHVKNYRILFERIDYLEEKVDALGRRVETEDSSFRLEKIATLEQFLLWERKLKDEKEEYNLLVRMFP